MSTPPTVPTAGRRPWPGEPDGLWPRRPLPERDERRSRQDRLAALSSIPRLAVPAAARVMEEVRAFIDLDVKVEYGGDWPLGVLWGPSDNGRTTVAREIVGRLQAERAGSAWDLRLPPTTGQLWLTIAGAGRQHGWVSTTRPRDVWQLEARAILAKAVAGGLRLVVFDQADVLLAMTPRARSLMQHALLHASSYANVPIVLVGAPELASRLQADRNRIGATERFHLPRLRVDAAYLDLLDQFEAFLPLARRSGLADRDMALHLFALCDGRLGALASILRKAATAAISSGRERIDVELLDDLGFEIPESFSGFVF